jgi:hypothetical protein
MLATSAPTRPTRNLANVTRDTNSIPQRDYGALLRFRLYVQRRCRTCIHRVRIASVMMYVVHERHSNALAERKQCVGCEAAVVVLKREP